MATAKQRADELLCDRGLAASPQQAARLIMAGRVLCDGRPLEKAGERLPADARLELREASRFVSRGGEKLAPTLERFGLPVRGRVCLDAGCSTGGFTDCLLQHGARLVHAVDVGYGQLAWSLRKDPRVIVHERTNVRLLRREQVDPAADLIVADLAFISLRAVLPVLHSLCRAPGDLLLLVKPQFELERAAVEEGVVRSEEARRRAADLVQARAVKLGLQPRGRADSPLAGPRGNREIFLWLGVGAER